MFEARFQTFDDSSDRAASAARVAALRAELKRRGLIAPHRIERVALERHQLAAGGGDRLAQMLQAGRRVEPRVIANLAPLRQVGLDPVLRRLVGRMARLEQAGIGLRANLKRVAPIDEDSGLVG